MNIIKYIWPVLLGIYIISPYDAHPLFFDYLSAAAVLFYLIYKNSKKGRHFGRDDYGKTNSDQYSQNRTSSYQSGPMTLDHADRIIGVTPDSSWDDISKAYKEKMSKSHPDKVSHLSKELQQKAGEITTQLNEAFELVRRHKGRR